MNSVQTLQQLGRYEIVAELGRGAMGAVFRARDPRIDRVVAIKTIAVAGASAKDMEEYRQRFFREAQAAGRLSHPGIVTIFDVDEDQASHTPFIVMEYVDGRPLDEFVAANADNRLPLATAVDLVQQIAVALDYAHASGIVHRDIKPGNVLVTPENRTKIADFGIAKLSMMEVTVPGQVLGTPAYMSPEQLSGNAIDGRSDLFSLGVIAYWLLTGVKPFTGQSITEVSIQVATKDPAPATQAAPELNKDFDYILRRALAKDPAQRYQHGKELAADLQDVLAGRAPRSRASTVEIPARTEQTIAVPAQQAKAPEQQQQRRYRRHSVLLYLFAAALLLLVGAGLFAISSSSGMPATLQIVGQYPFRTGEIYIWVDNDLRYHDELRGFSNPHAHLARVSSATGGSIALTLPVRAGRHTVRVQVDAPGQAFDHDTAIPGQFRAYSQKTLQVDFNSRNLDLRWE